MANATGFSRTMRNHSPSFPPAAPIIESDTTCLRCGYNLRGLSEDGRCPECGVEVAFSGGGDRLCHHHPRWLRTIRRGVRLTGLGTLLVLIFATVLMIEAFGIHLVGLEAGMQWMLAAGMLINAVGWWLLTRADPTRISIRPGERWLTLMRLASVLLPAVVLSVIVAHRWAESLLAFRAWGCAVVIAAALWLAATSISLRGMEILADRLPDDDLSWRLGALTWCIGIAGGLLTGSLLATFIADGAGALAKPLLLAWIMLAGLLGLFFIAALVQIWDLAQQLGLQILVAGGRRS